MRRFFLPGVFSARSLLFLAVTLSLIVTPAALSQASEVEPESTRILKKMTDFVNGLDKFSLDTDNMLEEVLESGQKIMFDFTASTTIKRPDRLRSEQTGDLFQQLVVYDGKALTIHNPQDGFYASTAVPDNIDDLLHFARDVLDIVPPTGDMVFTNSYELLTANLTAGMVIGKSMVGGVRCDHLAFRTPLVDWQVWISDGDEPLPYKYVLTTRDDPAQPQYIVLMSNWNTRPKVDEGMFEFTPPAGAQEIDFLRLDTGQTNLR